MKIDGWRDYDWRQTYKHDVVVRLSGEVVKRKKKLSKRLYGTSHVLSKDAANFSSRRGATRWSLARVRRATAAITGS
jgi:hypothetical protein